MTRNLSRSAITLALVAAGCAKAPQTTHEPVTPEVLSTNASVGAGTQAAQAWLASVDQGEYVQSWDAAAKPFQRAVGRDDWAHSVASVRGPLGKLVSRQLRSAEYKTSVPGAPDGKYVVIQFSTSFEKKANAVETITPVHEDDGAWRVSGYFIK